VSGLSTDSVEKPAWRLLGSTQGWQPEILSNEALDFVADLTRDFRPRLEALLRQRRSRQAHFRLGEKPSFRSDTAKIRDAEWLVAPLPADLQKRTVEITGPVDRKMVINALNSGADCFMADFEDSTAPSWSNVIHGQLNLRDAVRRQITFEDTARGKSYRLNEKVATLLVRPRGLHLQEKHFEVDGLPTPASLFDFALYFFHNAHALLRRESGPYFYLPKLEASEEAAWWNDLFVEAQRRLAVPEGTIKATVLIETLPAAFEMDEILYALREHSAGLNCGRWDYIFSYIKTLASDPGSVLPDRSQVGMTQPFMRAYSQWCIRTCHRRGVHAMGGMAAQIPIKGDEHANNEALDRVRADKRREAEDGHDGTWVAHPGLVALAREQFDAVVDGDHQIARLREDLSIDAAQLLEVPRGSRTEEGLKLNIRVGIRYLEAWLRGVGCVPLYHLMEDAATAEISRTQIWQWLRHGAELEDGQIVDEPLVRATLDEVLVEIEHEVGTTAFSVGCYDQAAVLFSDLCFSAELEEFLTLQAYDLLIQNDAGGQ
jgi:malate synthase